MYLSPLIPCLYPRLPPSHFPSLLSCVGASGAEALLCDCRDFFPQRYTTKNASASRRTPRLTPTPIPALAPVLRTLLDEEDDVEADAESVPVALAALFVLVVVALDVMMLLLLLEVELLLLLVLVLTIVLCALAAASSTLGAGAAQVSSVGLLQSRTPSDQLQQAQRPVSGL